MIPLITHTPRLLLLAASRALLTAELHKPRYFPVLLGAAKPLHILTASTTVRRLVNMAALTVADANAIR